MSESLVITLVLDEREAAEIGRIASVTSDINHPSYGAHLSRDALNELVLLDRGERQQILDWLRSHGMTPIDSPDTSPQLVFVSTNFDQVAAAFGHGLAGRLKQDDGFEKREGGRAVLAVPRRLAGFVQKVGGLPGDRGQAGIVIGGLTREKVGPDASSSGNGPAMSLPEGVGGEVPPPGFGGLTPADLRRIYEFPDRWDGSGETIALMLLGGQLDPEDLHRFWRAFQIDPPDVQVVQVGPQNPQPIHPLHQLEAAMTVEWAGAMAPGARIVVFNIDPSVMGDPWTAFFLALISEKSYEPTVATMSWITPERQYYQIHGHKVVTGLLDQAAALGITVLSATGDWGAFDGVPRAVVDGRNVGDAPWPHGVFPAVEERVLSVGGTMITSLTPHTELAWSGPPPPGLNIHFNLLAGSGGFSEEVPIPGWQRPALNTYYSRGARSPAVVPYGRGFPDVALAAAGPSVQRHPDAPLTSQGYQAMVAGQWVDYAGGTSVSAPIWAAIIALANQARREAGLSRVGFVNPLLYDIRESEPPPFRQILSGSSDVAMRVVNAEGKAVIFHMDGYEASDGWDPVTGLGVPRVSNLIDHLVRRGKEAKAQ